MKTIALLFATACLGSLISAPAQAAGEDYLVWKNVQIEFGEAPETGKLSVAATSDKDGIASLSITAFGMTFALAPEHLAAIRQFSLSSMKVTKVGAAVHFAFAREYYDPVKQLLLTKEEALLVVTKAGIKISVRPRNS
jgi:hypothetical protein